MSHDAVDLTVLHRSHTRRSNNLNMLLRVCDSMHIVQ